MNKIKQIKEVFDKIKDLNEEELSIISADLQYIMKNKNPNHKLIIDNPKLSGIYSQSLDIKYTEDGSALVYLNKNYVDIFGETLFYRKWLSQTKYDTILKISLENYDDEWNLEEFYFSPYLIRLKNHTSLYDLMNIEEKTFFRGLGTSILNELLKYILKISNTDSIITLGATNILKQHGDIIKLVQFYKKLSFQVDYDWYEKELGRKVTPNTIKHEIENIENVGFLKYVPMISTFEKVIEATNFV